MCTGKVKIKRKINIDSIPLVFLRDLELSLLFKGRLVIKSDFPFSLTSQGLGTHQVINFSDVL